jgi:eukaryotic-like serine/threonine-protein kinase
LSSQDTTKQDTMFGRSVLDQSLCTETELQQCFSEQKARVDGIPVTLEELLVEYGYITQSQAERIRAGISESRKVADRIPGYKIMGKLGSGAMAVVYKARQLSLDRIVAVKILPKRFVENQDYIDRFFKEGKIAAKLNHNNIVQAIDVGRAGDLYYFVMEYVEGKTLYDDLSKGKVFGEEDALDIIIQLVNALDHAHSNGMIHRDVKPKNVMINAAGVVKLADMGLARETSDLISAKNEQGKAFGTPYYIAPEQIRGKMDIDGRADIYALGATFFHMVTGRVPFDGDTPSDVMRKHLKEPLTPPDHINVSLSSGIAEVIEVMMAKKKKDRYDNAKEVLIDLEAIRNGQPPVLARRKFDMESLEELQKGILVDVDGDEEKFYGTETITRYRVFITILIAIIIMLVLFLFL